MQSSYPNLTQNPPPPDLTPEMFMNWWNGNWQWLLPILIVLAIIILILTILMIVSTWKIFKKANQPGWAAIVPFYNTYILVKVIRRPIWMFWVYLGLGFVAAIPAINGLANIGLFAFSIVWALDLAKVFGQSTGFGVATIFFPIVTYPILGFKKDISYVSETATTKPEATEAPPAGTSAPEGPQNKKSSTTLVVVLAIVIPVFLIIMGILAAIIVGVIAAGSKGTATNQCAIAYAKNIETAVESYKNTNNVYPTSIESLSESALDRRMYELCSANVSYYSDGKSYTVRAKLKEYKGADANIKNDTYTLTK